MKTPKKVTTPYLCVYHNGTKNFNYDDGEWVFRECKDLEELAQAKENHGKLGSCMLLKLVDVEVRKTFTEVKYQQPVDPDDLPF